jgi:hypothetical protein
MLKPYANCYTKKKNLNRFAHRVNRSLKLKHLTYSAFDANNAAGPIALTVCAASSTAY